MTNATCIEERFRSVLPVAAPRLVHLFCSVSWGSRPRQIICRRSAARTGDQGWEFFVAERWRRFPLRPTMSAMERLRCFSSKRMILEMERRRRGRYLAWGVSPGVGESNSERAPGGGGRYLARGVSPGVGESNSERAPGGGGRYLARGVSPGVGESNSERAPGGGGRYIAWGVSPRYEETKLRLSPRRGRQIHSLGRKPRGWGIKQ